VKQIIARAKGTKEFVRHRESSARLELSANGKRALGILISQDR